MPARVRPRLARVPMSQLDLRHPDRRPRARARAEAAGDGPGRGAPRTDRRASATERVSAHTTRLLVVAAAALATSGCGRSEPEKRRSPADPLSACVQAWNRPANFDHGEPGNLVG